VAARHSMVVKIEKEKVQKEKDEIEESIKTAERGRKYDKTSSQTEDFRKKLDREREELKRLRVSKRAPNAPIASEDEDDGELLDALGGGSLYDGSSNK